MAVTNTPRFGFTLFGAGADPFVTRGQYNADMQAADQLGAQFAQGTLVQFQSTAPGVAGRLYKIAGDSALNNGRLFYDDGAAWTEIATMAPASLAILTAALVPVGQLSMFAADTFPAGWLYCDGSLHPNSQYPLLSAYLGPNWARPGNQFALPDYRGCVIIGRVIGVGGISGIPGPVGQHQHANSGNTGTEQGTHWHPQSTPGGGITGPETTPHVHAYTSATANGYAATGNPATIAIKAA